MSVAPWRTRASIQSFAPLSEEEFLIGNFKILSRPDLVSPQASKDVHIVDVILKDLDEPNVEEAHIIGIDALENFLDRISVVAYAPCRLFKIISTCPVEVSVDEPFNMVTEDLLQEVESPEIKPEHLAPFNEIPEDSPVLLASHLVRQALNSEVVEQHLLHLHNAAERIAVNESDERIQNKCPKCEHRWDGQPASKRAVRKLLQARNVSRKNADDSMEYRSRIAHGGGRRNVAFNERVTDLAGAIESAVISTVADRAGVIAQRRAGVVVGLPITLHKAVKRDDGSFDLIETQWKAPIRFPQLDDDVSVAKGKALAGLPTRPDGTPNIDCSSHYLI